MRSRFAWFLAGALLAGALLQRLVLRREAPPEPRGPDLPPDPRVEELKRRLADARAATQEAEAEPPAEVAFEPEPEPAVTPKPPPAPAPGLDERRRSVHLRARGAVDEMRSGERPPGA